MEQLLDYLRSIPQGQIVDCGQLESLLANCWEDFRGANAEGMEARKLFGRMEDIFWKPPVLTFTLERHGGTALGSTRAELQYWQVNIETRSAACSAGSYRQVTRMQPRLNVKPIANVIVGLIIERRQDKRLKWHTDDSVHLLIGKILPRDSAVKQTLRGRRKRFSAEVEQLLATHGWRRVKANVYARS